MRDAPPDPAAPARQHRNQLSWAALSAATFIALAVLGGAIASSYVRRTAREQALARTDIAADAATQRSQRLLEALDSQFDQAQIAYHLDRARLATADLATAGLATGLVPASHAVAATLEQAAARTGLGAITIIDAAGRPLWPAGATIRHLPPAVLTARPDGIQIDADGNALLFSRAVRDTDGHLLGFAVTSIDRLILSAKLARAGLGPDVAALLVQLPRGHILADSAAPALPDRPQTLAPADLRRIAADPAGASLSATAAAGRPGFLAFRRLAPQTGDTLAVAAVIDAARALAPAMRTCRLIDLAVALCALVALFGLAMRILTLRRRLERGALIAARQQITAVKAVRAELERLLTSLPVAAYQAHVRPDGHYARRYVSPMLAQITGWPMAGLSDAAQWERKLEDGAGRRLAEFFANVLHDGEGSIEYRMHRRDGGWCWLRETARVAARLPAGGGEVIGAISDVTTEGELAEQAATAQKLAMLGEMATGLAHELNQPITVIGLAADRAQDAIDATPVDHEAASHALARIAAQVQRSADIIDQLRLFGRGDVQPVGPVPLDQAVAGAMILAEGPLREAGIPLTIDLPDRLPLVQGRLVQIEQVLVNLSLNARDALLARPEGQRRLSIAAEITADCVRLRVADTAGGIAPAIMARLFDPFVTSKPQGAGSGLGLSICRRLMHGMTGDIAARNGEHGAVFTLTFRIAPQPSLALSGSAHTNPP